MITTAAPRRPDLSIALVLSLVLHAVVLGAYLLWGTRHVLLVAKPAARSELAATNDVVHIERRTVPRAAVHRRTHPTPPQPVPRTLQPPVAKVPVVRAVHELAQLKKRAPAGPADSATAELERALHETIAQAQSDATNVRPPKQQPATIRHDDLVMPGAPLDLKGARALYEVLRAGSDGDRDWYYLKVNVVWADGYGETVDIPWPVYFPHDDDPIVAKQPFYAIPPPADYHLPHPFAPSRIVCYYFHDECQAAFDAAADESSE